MIIDYLTPSTLDEAMAALVKQPHRSAVIAGGTEGFADLQKSKKEVVAVDISEVKGLDKISRHKQDSEIGATVSLAQVLQTTWLIKRIPALYEAFFRMASPQIRNQGTLVGNVMTGRAVANGRVCLASMGAYLNVVGPNGRKTIDIDKLGQAKNKVGQDEIAVSVTIPQKSWTKASAYADFLPRKAFAYASASVSAALTVKEGLFESVFLVVSPILPKMKKTEMKPCYTCSGSCRICRIKHLEEIEKGLIGRREQVQEIEQICDDFDWNKIPMRHSMTNGTPEYRRNLLKVLSKKALNKALDRANM